MRKIFIFIKPVAWLIVVIILSLLPSNKLPNVNRFHIPHFDKIVHFVMYFVLSFLIVLSFFDYKRLYNNFSMQKAYIITVATTLLIGFLLEVLQYFLKIERSAETLDFVANAIGSVAGCAFFYSYFIMRFPKLNNSRINN